MEAKQSASDDDMSIDETLEESSFTRRLLEDIGGQPNLSFFYSLLKDYSEDHVQIDAKFSSFREKISHTNFDYAYCVKNSYLFVKFLEQCPKYMEAVWFMKEYTKIRLTQTKVDFLQLIEGFSVGQYEDFTTITLNNKKIIIPLTSADDQLILQTYFANEKGRLFSTQKLNRQYEYSYEEWVKFLSQLFPADSLAIYQSNEMLNKRLKKNDRNRVYREQANQRKEDSSKNKDTEKTHKRTLVNVEEKHGKTSYIKSKLLEQTEDCSGISSVTSPRMPRRIRNKGSALLDGQNQEYNVQTEMEGTLPDLYITIESQLGAKVELSTSEAKVIADIYNENNEVIWEMGKNAYNSEYKRESSNMTIDGVNVLTSLNQDMASDLTASISSDTYLDDALSKALSQFRTKKRQGRVDTFVQDVRLYQHINSVSNHGIKGALEKFFKEYSKDVIVEDFQIWHGRYNLPLKHNKNYKDPYIHFPWENNSCALDATMSAWWIVYNKIYESAERDLLVLFNYEYKLLIKIFKNLHEGMINNIQAKEALREILNDCNDPTYTEEGYMTIDVLQMYMENKVYTRYEGGNTNRSIFHWYYDLICSCESCNTERRGLKSNLNLFHCGVVCDDVYNSIQDALDACIIQEDPHLQCPVCAKVYKCHKITKVQPHIVTLTIPVIDISNTANYKMNSIDRTIILNDLEYELLAAVYGDHSHFVCRYVFENRIYEADGMQEYKLGDGPFELHAAESKLISDDYDKDMNIIINKKLAKRFHKQVATIYYIMKQ